MKKFCLIIAVILVFVVSCDNLYNDVAEEKKDMQKLIFVNADGVSVDLTKDPYGITEWEGFSKVDLNLQTQQVPFHDGSVYLDGLLSERELSVTLAMNDEKNLEKRYRLRRELIEILNPKLGEGTLIYTNNYTSKQIKVVPQTPLFETHNSNDSGTPKASLAWTACSPYWEDVDETEIDFRTGEIPVINNNGDIPVSLKVNLTGDVDNPKLINMTNGQEIEWNSTTDEVLSINTESGEKNVMEGVFDFETNMFVFINSIAFSPTLGLYVGVGEHGAIQTSKNLIDWEIQYSGTGNRLVKVIYIESKQKFMAVGIKTAGSIVLFSSDGINWILSETTGAENLIDVVYSPELDKYVGISDGDSYMYSSDGINWTSGRLENNDNFDANNIVYSADLQKFVVVGTNLFSNYSKIFASSDGETFSSVLVLNNEDIKSITYAENLSIFIVTIGNAVYISSDGENWTRETINVPVEYIKYISEKNIIVSHQRIGGQYYYATICYSYDGVNWLNGGEIKDSSRSIFITDIIYAPTLNMYTAVGTVISNSVNLINWNIQKMTISDFNSDVEYYEGIDAYIARDNKYMYISPDGINWTSHLISSSGRINNITYSNEKKMFLATGVEPLSESYYLAFISSDGINWESHIIENIVVRDWTKKVIYVDSLHEFIIITETCIFTTSDGINWVERYNGNQIYMQDILYAPEYSKLVAIGFNNANSEKSKIIESTDGITWEEVATNINTRLSKIIYSSKMRCFVAIGNNYAYTSGKVFVSFDNEIWTLINIGEYRLGSLCFSNEYNLFLVTAYSGYIFVSSDAINWSRKECKLKEPFTDVVYNTKLNAFILYPVITEYRIITSQNVIQYLSKNSNMNFRLEKGENRLMLQNQNDNLFAQLLYRQKYIGV